MDGFGTGHQYLFRLPINVIIYKESGRCDMVGVFVLVVEQHGHRFRCSGAFVEQARIGDR